MGAEFRRRHRHVAITTPAGTAVASPQSTTVALGPVTVRSVQVIIPDGHAGHTGIAIHHAGERVLPFQGTEWIGGNDDSPTFDLDLWIGGGEVVVQTFNTGDYDHDHLLRFTIEDVEALAAGGTPLTPPEQIEAFQPPAEVLPEIVEAPPIGEMVEVLPAEEAEAV